MVVMEKSAAAIVLGQGINGLGVSRNLGRLGINVICLATKDDFALRSRYLDKVMVDNNLDSHPDKLLYKLSAIASENPSEEFVLFPCSDGFLQILVQIRHELPQNIKLNIPKAEVLDLFIDKWKFYSWLEKNNMPHPKSYYPKSCNELWDLRDRIQYPVFIKPLESHKFRRIFQGRKGFTCNHFDELMSAYQQALENDIQVMVNEKIPGSSDNHFFIDGYVDKGGEIKAIFARRRLHMFPPDWGNSSSMVSIAKEKIQPAIDNLITIIDKSGVKGIFSAEIKQDPRDRLYKFIEINVRSWWYNLFPTTCGINIIKMAFDDMTEGVEEIETYKNNKYHIYFWPEIKALRSLYRAKKITLIETIKRLKICFNSPVFAIDDLRPFFQRIIEAIKNKYCDTCVRKTPLTD